MIGLRRKSRYFRHPHSRYMAQSSQRLTKHISKVLGSTEDSTHALVAYSCRKIAHLLPEGESEVISVAGTVALTPLLHFLRYIFNCSFMYRQFVLLTVSTYYTEKSKNSVKIFSTLIYLLFTLF